jgi:predicted transcriptional regulator
MYQEQTDPDFVIHLISRFDDDQLVEWHERAGIYEYEANMSRDAAEYKAACDILSQIAQRMRKKGTR